nr:protein LONGIFOLIA 1 isoform X2 [Ipomoea batatas]
MNNAGVEAPRNSLDMEEPTVGINQIRTSCDSRPSSCKPRSDDFSSECSSSPGGAKTPNLVARLMGLDLLPENASPTFGNSRKSNLQPRTEPRDRARYLLHQDRRSRSFNVLDNADISGAGGTVSLPETPRISLARKSDVDHHHRLSLQINKENVGEEFDQFSSGKRSARSRRREALRQVDENIRSPSFYARQIVKQVKESVSRKVGAADITIHKNNLKKDHNLDNNQVVLLKPSKPSLFLQDNNFSPTKHQSCSPRFRFLEPKPTKPPPSNTDNFTPPPKPPQKVIPKPKSQENKNNLKKPAAIRSKKEEPFVRPANINHETKKGKRSELLNPNNVPTILPAFKKDCRECRPSSSPPKLPQKQAQNDALSSKKSSPQQLSSSPSQSYHHPLTTSKEKNIIVRDDRNGAAGEEQAEFQYIQRILKRTGVEKDSSVSLAKWYSSSHPLDPSIFHYIELFHHNPAIKNSKLQLRCNRKLVFQLIDELLVGILKPYLGSRVGRNMTGSELMETLCSKVRNFPSADCQVLTSERRSHGSSPRD